MDDILREPALRAGAAAAVRGLRDVARLVLPVECPGCGRWDEVLCDGCAVVLVEPVVRCEQHVPRLDRMDGYEPLPVWRVAPYAGPARGIVVAWKDHGRSDLTPVLQEAVRRAAAEVAPQLGAAAGGSPVRVVPVPSSPGARRRRGADLVGLLAAAGAEGLVGAGVPAEVSAVLRRRRGGRDQVGLGARARARNTTGTVLVRPGEGAVGGPSVHLLVDDVVTTGSTLAACETALVQSGHAVVGALVLAATPPPSSIRRRLLLGPQED